MENYKKKYEDAVNKIKSIIADKKKQGLTNCLFEGDLNEIFPQLKESEDERIRKALISAIQVAWNNGGFSFDTKRVDIDAWIAWLEKQGETFTKKDVDDAWLKGMCDAKRELEKQGEQEETPCDRCKKAQPEHSCQDITELGRCYQELEKQVGSAETMKKNLVKDGIELVKQREQKPAWGEEDEQNFYWISTTIQERPLTPEYTQQVHKILSWLKSLKPQSHWKPTDEQMDLLYWVKENRVFDYADREILRSLYDELKKL